MMRIVGEEEIVEKVVPVQERRLNDFDKSKVQNKFLEILKEREKVVKNDFGEIGEVPYLSRVEEGGLHSFKKVSCEEASFGGNK